MNIYFIRHPETKWNRAGITQGHKDSPLTEQGKATAEKLGSLLRDKNIEIIYSSDLGRCVQTAGIVNSFLNKEVVLTDRLREQNFGDLNGATREEILEKLDLSNLDLAAPNGESFNQMKKRVLEFIKSLPNEEFKNVLLVTHDGVTRAILSEYNVTKQDDIYKLNL